MNYDAIQALKAAVAGTLLVAGLGLLLAGAVTLLLGISDPSRDSAIAQGSVWLAVGAILTVFSRLVPPPVSQF